MSLRTNLGEMRTFFVVWSGQLVSTVGSNLTGFALGVWVYQETGSTTLFALTMLSFMVPNILLAPLAGALVDRWDRRLVMILSDTGAGLSTLIVALLYFSGRLEVWHIYVLTALNASFTVFQWPAYSAATTLLVPKRHLGRAGGMVQIGEAVSQLIAPAIAGAMLVTVGIGGVVIVDFLTFSVAILTLFFVRFPKPKVSQAGQESKGSIWKEAAYGWRYITSRPGLLGLLLIFAMMNLLFGFTNPLIAPMVLEMTSADMLGYLASLIGVGMLIGTLVMSAWGGPKRRIHGVLGFMIIQSVFLGMLGLRASIPWMAFAGFWMMFFNPIINGSSQALWQAKVATDVQGRVFSVRRMIAWSTTPLAYLLSGPMADKVFTPLMLEGGGLASTWVGKIVGVGPGRGIGVMFVLVALLSMIVAAAGYLNPRVRRVEIELPDAVPDEDEVLDSAAMTASHPNEPANTMEAIPAD